MIIDFEWLIQHFDPSEMKACTMPTTIKLVEKMPYAFDSKSNYEPYYCFFFWLWKKEAKILFLPSVHPLENDLISNAVLAPNQEIVLLHTWYARAYGKSEKHTIRINDIIYKIPKSRSPKINYTIYKDNFFYFKKKYQKITKKMVKFVSVK